MNKRVVLVILMIAASLSASAGGGLLQFGVKAGITSQSVDIMHPDAGLNKLASDGRAGFQIGVISRVNLAMFHIQPELIYSINSYKLIAAPTGQGSEDRKISTSKVRTSTVEMPVMVGLRLLFLRISAGPVFNLMTDNTVKSEKNSTLHGVEIIKPTISFAAGLGADIGKVNIDLRYYGQFKRPLQNIKIADQPDHNYKTKMRCWALSLGYMF